jgi:hypothetical protein
MADRHQIVDQIRAFVQSSDQTRSGVLESLASSYADACVEVNQRMGRCHRLLQQGLRSEAIQLADSEPRLLDTLAELDFPERADWDELVRIYELAAAPKLAVDQAQFLNEAYAQEDPLQDMLRTHRRMALQRAPIKSRIAVMRKLAAQDANNPIWTEDLRTFEIARFRQVQSEATQAVQSRESGVLSQLLAEVDQQAWVEPPPKALLQGLRKADAQFRDQQTRALLSDLDARLNDAFIARDPIRGRIARQEWIALTSKAPLDPKEPIWDRVGPALAWLEEQDRIAEEDHNHETAVNALVCALDNPAHISPVQLERLAHAVLQYGRGMAERVQVRYVTRLRSAEAAQTLRRRVAVSGAVAGVLLVGGLSFYLIQGWARASDAAQAATALVDMIDLGNVDEAGAFLDQVTKADQGLLAYPPMIEARARLQALRDKEADRAAQFEKSFRASERAPVFQLDPPDLQSTRKLARLPSEKQAIEQLVRQRATALEAARATHEKDVGPRLDAVGRKIAEIQRKLEAEAPAKIDGLQVTEPLAEAQHSLAELQPELPYVGERLQSLATVLGQKIDATLARLDQRRRLVRLEAGMTEAVAFSVKDAAAGITKFANSLDNYITSFPDEPRSQAFRQTRSEQSLWNDVEAWNQLIQQWKGDAIGTAPADGKIRAERCGRFLSEHAGSPDYDAIAHYQKHLEAIARRGLEPDSANTKIQRLLSDILVENIWMIKVKEERGGGYMCYYLAGKPTRGLAPMRHLVGFDGKERRKLIVKEQVVSSDWSPQSKISAMFKPVLLQESTASNWEKVMVNLASQIRTQPSIDQVLQVALLRNVLEQAANGSIPLGEALTTTRMLLEQADINVNVSWMDPDDLDAEKMRPKAARLVQAIPDFFDILKRALLRRDQIERGVTRLPRPVGWLAREQQAWHVRTKSAVPSLGDLWVVVPSEDKRGRWQKVGTVAGDKAQLSGENIASLAEGRLVFVMTRPAG